MECKKCHDEVDELVMVRFGRKKIKVCMDCAERIREEEEVAEEAEGVMQGMMEYRGRR